MHSDHVANFLTCIRNGYSARKPRVQVPFKRLLRQLAQVLKDEGYIGEFREVGREAASRVLEVQLRYDEKRQAVLSRIDRVSKPGRRVTYACDDIPKVLGGLGVIVLTTSRGLMTDRAARKARVGGEALCAVC